jgi:hypothetical protein
MEKLLPQNIEAEEGVIGSTIIDPEIAVMLRPAISTGKPIAPSGTPFRSWSGSGFPLTSSPSAMTSSAMASWRTWVAPPISLRW